MGIPSLLIYSIFKKRVFIQIPRVGILFVSFILSCGFTHLLGAVVFKWPVYYLSAFSSVVTACISFTTMIYMYKVIPYALTLKTPRELEEINNVLHDKVKALEAFQYSVCHDLNAPLRIMEGFSEILVEDYSNKNLDGVAKDYLSRIKKSSKKMRMLVNDLYRLSKLDTTTVVFEKFSISDMTKNIVDDYSGKKAEIYIEKNIYVEGDKQLIEIVIKNLIDNAFKFSSKKDITKIRFGKIVDGNKLIYYIRDNGCGFDNAKYNQLFKPFTRLHNSEDYSGTGIGLALSKRIVDLHGGSIWANSKIGEYTVFYFTIGYKNE